MIEIERIIPEKKESSLKNMISDRLNSFTKFQQQRQSEEPKELKENKENTDGKEVIDIDETKSVQSKQSEKDPSVVVVSVSKPLKKKTSTRLFNKERILQQYGELDEHGEPVKQVKIFIFPHEHQTPQHSNNEWNNSDDWNH